MVGRQAINSRYTSHKSWNDPQIHKRLDTSTLGGSISWTPWEKKCETRCGGFDPKRWRFCCCCCCCCCCCRLLNGKWQKFLFFSQAKHHMSGSVGHKQFLPFVYQLRNGEVIFPVPEVKQNNPCALKTLDVWKFFFEPQLGGDTKYSTFSGFGAFWGWMVGPITQTCAAYTMEFRYGNTCFVKNHVHNPIGCFNLTITTTSLQSTTVVKRNWTLQP